MVADLSTDDGVDAVAEVCATEPLTMLVNTAGGAHYMSLAELPPAWPGSSSTSRWSPRRC